MAMEKIGVSLSFTADTSQAKAQLLDLQKTLSNLTTSTTKASNLGFDKDIAKATQEASKLQNILKKSTLSNGLLDFNKFTNGIKSSNTSVEQYAKSFKMLGSEGQSAFNKIATAIGNSTISLSKTETVFSRFVDQMKATAKWQISGTIFRSFTSSIREAYQYAETLNKSLNNIRIITNKTTDEMSDFAAQANKAAKALSVNTTAYTDASLIFYQQGLNGKDVADRTEAVLKLSNITKDSVEEVSSYMTAIWNNFNDGSASLESYADKITALGAATASSSAEIAEGLEKFASVADTVGLSYDYATTALATVVAQTRQSADTVGTAFKTLFARIQDLELGDTLEDGTTLGQYSEALEKIGVNIKNSSGEVKSMNEILDDMGNKWGTLSKDTQIATAQAVAGTRQYAQLIALMDNWDKFKSNLSIAENADGTLQQQQEIYAESWEAARKRVSASLQGIYQQLFDDKVFIKLTNGVAVFVEGIDNIVKSFNGLKGMLPIIAGLIGKLWGNDILIGMKQFSQSIQFLLPGGTQKMIDSQINEKTKWDTLSLKMYNPNYGKEGDDESAVLESRRAAYEMEKNRISLQNEYITKMVQMKALGLEISEEDQRNLQTEMDNLRILQDEYIAEEKRLQLKEEASIIALEDNALNVDSLNQLGVGYTSDQYIEAAAEADRLTRSLTYLQDASDIVKEKLKEAFKSSNVSPDIDALKEQIKGIFSSIQMSPEDSNIFSDMINGLVQKVSNNSNNRSIDGIFANFIGDQRKQANDVYLTGGQEFNQAVEQEINNIKKEISAYEELAKKIEELKQLKEEYDKISTMPNESADKIKATQDFQRKFNKTFNTNEKQPEIAETMNSLKIDDNNKITTTGTSLNKFISDLGNTENIDDLKLKLQELLRTFKETQDGMAGGAPAMSESEVAAARLSEKYGELVARGDQLKETLNNLKSAPMDWTGAISSATTSMTQLGMAMTSVVSLGNTLKGVFEGTTSPIQALTTSLIMIPMLLKNALSFAQPLLNIAKEQIAITELQNGLSETKNAILAKEATIQEAQEAVTQRRLELEANQNEYEMIQVFIEEQQFAIKEAESALPEAYDNTIGNEYMEQFVSQEEITIEQEKAILQEAELDREEAIWWVKRKQIELERAELELKALEEGPETGNLAIQELNNGAKLQENEITKRQIALEQLKNKTILSNPYVLAGAAIIATIAAIALSIKFVNDQTKITEEQASEAAEKLTNAYKNQKQALDDLKSSIESYEEGKKSLEELTKGTDEWNSKVLELNQNLIELMSKYPTLAKLISDTNNDGILELDTSSKEYQDFLVQQQQDLQRIQTSELFVEGLKYKSKTDDKNLGDSYKRVGSEIVDNARAKGITLNAEDEGNLTGIASDDSFMRNLIQEVKNDSSILGNKKALGEFIDKNIADSTYYKDVDRENLISAIQDSGKSIIDLTNTINANEEAYEKINHEATKSYLDSLDNKDYKGSEFKDQIASAIQKNAEDLDITTWNTKWDKEVQQEYAKEKGWTWVKQDAKGNGYYKDASGQEQVIADSVARAALNQRDALEEASKSLGDFTDILNDISAMDASESLKQAYANFALSGDMSNLDGLKAGEIDDYFEYVEKSDVKKDYSFLENASEETLKELLGDDFETYTLDDGTFNRAGFIRDLKEEDAYLFEILNDKEKNIQGKLEKNWKESFNNITKRSAVSVQKAFKDIAYDNDGNIREDLGQEEGQAIKTALETAFVNGSEGFEKVKEIFKKTGESSDELAAGLNKLDWSSINDVKDMKKELSSLGVVTEALTENQLQDLYDAFKKIEKVNLDDFYKKNADIEKITKNLKTGGAISTEDYDTLRSSGADIEGYFQKLDNGTVKLIGDAEEFYKVINEGKVEKTKEAIDQTKEDIANLEKGAELYEELNEKEDVKEQVLDTETYVGITNSPTGDKEIADATLRKRFELLQMDSNFLTDEQRARFSDFMKNGSDDKEYANLIAEEINNVFTEHWADMVNESNNKDGIIADMEQQIDDAGYAGAASIASKEEWNKYKNDNTIDLDTNSEEYNKALASHLQAEAEAAGMTTEELTAYKDSLVALHPELASESELLGELAIKQYRNEKGTKKLVDKVNSLADSTKKGKNAIKQMRDALNGMGTMTADAAETLDLYKEGIADILNVDKSSIDNDFVKTYFDDIQGYINSTGKEREKYFSELQKDYAKAELAKKEYIGEESTGKKYVGGELQDVKIPVVIDTDNLVDQVNELTNSDEFNQIEIGELINLDNLPDKFQPLKDTLNSMSSLTQEEVNEINAQLAEIGIELEWEEVSEKEIASLNFLASSGYAGKEAADYAQKQLASIKANGMRLVPKKTSSSKPSTYDGTRKGGGGGGSTPSKIDYDPYHKIDRELKKLARTYEDLESAEEGVWGQDKIDIMDQKIALIDKEIAKEKQRLAIAKEEMEISKQDLTDYVSKNKDALNGLELQFDADGEIFNYDQLITLFREYDRAIAGIGEGEQETPELKQTKEIYSKLKEFVDKYESNVDAKNETEDTIKEEEEKKYQEFLKKFKYQIELKLDKAKLKKEWIDFQKTMGTNSLQSGFASWINGARYDLASLKTQLGHNGELQTLTKSIKGILNNPDIKDGDKQSMLKDQLSQLQSAMEAIKTLEDSILEGYNEIITDASTLFDYQINQYTHINNLLSHQSKLIELLYGEEAYDRQAKYYEKVFESNIGQMQFLKDEISYWEDLMSKLEQGSDQWKSAQEKLQSTQESLNTLIEDSIQNIVTQYETAIKGILKAAKDALFDNNFDDLKMHYELYQKMNDMILSPVNQLVEAQKLITNIQKEIDNNNGNIAAQNKLQSLLDREVEALQDMGEARQYDVDRANALYDITLKQIALDDAQAAKSALRLVRDSQGNWVYQYTADLDAVRDAEEALMESESALFDIDNSALSEYTDNFISTYEDMFSKIEEITNNFSAKKIDASTMESQIKDTVNTYSEMLQTYYTGIQDASENLSASAFGTLGQLLTMDSSAFETFTDEEQAYIKNLVSSTDDFITYLRNFDSSDVSDDLGKSIMKQMNSLFGLDMTVNMSGSWDDWVEDLIDQLTQQGSLYAARLAQIEETSGEDLADTNGNLDKISTQTSDLISTNKTMIKTIQDNTNTILKVIDTMQALLNKYGKAMKNAEHAAIDAYQYSTESSVPNSRMRVSGKSSGSSRTSMSTSDYVKSILGYNKGGVVTAASGTVATSGGSIFDSIAKSLGEDTMIAAKAGERVLTSQQTSAFDNLVYNLLPKLSNLSFEIPSLTSSIGEAITSGINNMISKLGELAAKDISSTAVQQTPQPASNTFNIQAEFPNATSASEIEEALLSLENYASQYVWKK